MFKGYFFSYVHEWVMVICIALCSVLLLSTHLQTHAQESVITTPTQSILITEIALQGTKSSTTQCKAYEGAKVTCAHDKWIELYNASNADVDLKTYTLSFGTNAQQEFIRAVPLEGILPAHSLMLVSNKNSALASQIAPFHPRIEVGFLHGLSRIESATHDAALSSFVRVQLSESNGGVIQTVSESISCDAVSSIEYHFETRTFQCSTTQWNNMYASPQVLSAVQLAAPQNKESYTESVQIGNEDVYTDEQTQEIILPHGEQVVEPVYTAEVNRAGEEVQKTSETVLTDKGNTFAPSFVQTATPPLPISAHNEYRAQSPHVIPSTIDSAYTQNITAREVLTQGVASKITVPDTSHLNHTKTTVQEVDIQGHMYNVYGEEYTPDVMSTDTPHTQDNSSQYDRRDIHTMGREHIVYAMRTLIQVCVCVIVCWSVHMGVLYLQHAYAFRMSYSIQSMQTGRLPHYV